MNILLTSVGRRSYLVNFFKDAAGPKGRVISANSEQLTSGMVAADKAYKVPQVNSSDYVSEILNICLKENVSLVVPLFDIDLKYLSEARSQFVEAGIELAVSDPWVIEVANDKWKTFLWLKDQGIASPATYLDIDTVIESHKRGELKFPLIIKPRWGMGSISVYRADSVEELNFFYTYAKRQIEKSYLKILSHDEIDQAVVIQEFISGNEYGLDIFNDLKGFYLATISKLKIAMRSGETDMAKIIEDSRLEHLGEKLGSDLRHRGNMDVDVLEDSSGKLYVLEMNARFGGGYPFSHLAGANFPLALVDMVSGRSPRGINYMQNGIVGLKNIDVIKAVP